MTDPYIYFCFILIQSHKNSPRIQTIERTKHISHPFLLKIINSNQAAATQIKAAANVSLIKTKQMFLFSLSWFGKKKKIAEEGKPQQRERRIEKHLEQLLKG